MSPLASAPEGLFQPIDLALQEALARHGGDPWLGVAGALASAALGEGHARLPLRGDLSPWLPEVPGASAFLSEAVDLAQVRAALEEASLAGETPATPLVWREGHLWLGRWFAHELGLARQLLARARRPVPPVDEAWAKEVEGALFAGLSGDSQRQAVSQALRRGLVVLAGGPGTGKTTTVVRLLASLLAQEAARGAPLSRTLLLAPTGKAAARLSESMQRQITDLPIPGPHAEAVRAALPRVARTVHRALKPRNDFLTQVHHDEETPWSEDVVVVDETSMVDLALMHRLVCAVKPGARLILVGDPDQLAAVGVGQVLADLCDPELSGPVGEGVVQLVGSRRFDDAGAVGQLARAIHEGKAAEACAVLDSGGDAAWGEVHPRGLSRHRAFLDSMVARWRPLTEAQGPEAGLAALDRLRVLCATRVGPSGVEALNEAITEALGQATALEPTEDGLWAGRPVLVTANDYGVGLFNGDVGLLAHDDDGRLRAWFRVDDTLRAVLPSRLPAHETCFAMTVHKSQGSEFEEVVLVAPEAEARGLDRALLYTAVTRARARVVVHGTPAVVEAALQRAGGRASGLVELLSSEGSPPGAAG